MIPSQCRLSHSHTHTHTRIHEHAFLACPLIITQSSSTYADSVHRVPQAVGTQTEDMILSTDIDTSMLPRLSSKMTVKALKAEVCTVGTIIGHINAAFHVCLWPLHAPLVCDNVTWTCWHLYVCVCVCVCMCVCVSTMYQCMSVQYQPLCCQLAFSHGCDSTALSCI